MNQPRPESSLPPLATAEHFLACVDVMVDWNALEPLLASTSGGAARPLTLPALKIALLRQWYGIADSEAPFAVLDRFSFRAFVGFNDDGSPGDAAIVQELHQGSACRHPAMAELIGAVEGQLRELGYAVRGGYLREPSIAPRTQSGEQGTPAGTTSLFRTGELGRMVEAVTAKAHSGSVAPEVERPAADRPAPAPVSPPDEPEAASESVSAEEPEAASEPISAPDEPEVVSDPVPAPAEQEAAPDLISASAEPEAAAEPEPFRVILEWPWGEHMEVESHLCIGRDYTFSPLAHELTPYTHVSRKHAELMVYGDGVWVRDLGSRNGTYVNDEEVPKGQAFLIDGDATVRFGPLLAVALKITTA